MTFDEALARSFATGPFSSHMLRLFRAPWGWY
jgi:hypothetical protein